jgi:hypothetical protein
MFASSQGLVSGKKAQEKGCPWRAIGSITLKVIHITPLTTPKVAA